MSVTRPFAVPPLQLFSGISSFHTLITAASSPPALRNRVYPHSLCSELPQSSFPTFIILTNFSSLLSAFSSLSRLLLFNLKTSLHESFSTFLSTIKMSFPSFYFCVTSLYLSKHFCADSVLLFSPCRNFT